MGSLIDKDGVIYEKGWSGEYKPKQGWFSPKKDTNWLGQPNIECDFFGNPKVERDWLGRPIRSQSGANLYRHSGNASQRNRSSSSDETIGCLTIAVLVIMLIIALTVFLWIVFPVFVMLWHGLSTKNGRRDLGIFFMAALILTGMAVLSISALDTIIYTRLLH